MTRWFLFTSAFKYTEVWEDLDESENFVQKHDQYPGMRLFGPIQKIHTIPYSLFAIPVDTPLSCRQAFDTKMAREEVEPKVITQFRFVERRLNIDPDMRACMSLLDYYVSSDLDLERLEALCASTWKKNQQTTARIQQQLTTFNGSPR